MQSAALAGALNAAFIASLCWVAPPDRPDPTPVIEVALVRAPIAALEAPSAPSGRAPAPRAIRAARPDDRPAGSSAPPATEAFAQEDAGTKYRLLAAPFNACPALFVHDRLYRSGAADSACEDPGEAGHDREPPPAPRQYALDGPPRILFGDKDSVLPEAAQKIALTPRP